MSVTTEERLISALTVSRWFCGSSRLLGYRTAGRLPVYGTSAQRLSASREAKRSALSGLGISDQQLVSTSRQLLQRSVYNIPKGTGKKHLKPRQLVTIEGIKGIKDSSGDINRLCTAGRLWSVLVGSSEDLWAHALGAQGTYRRYCKRKVVVDLWRAEGRRREAAFATGRN